MGRCPDCGARLAEPETCRGRFGACLTLEYLHPTTFGAVHHLSVMCYALQHNQYAKVAWLDARDILAQCVSGGLTGAEFLRMSRERLGTKRNGSISRGKKLTDVADIPWSVRVVDIATADPATYEADVLRWAASVVADTADFTARHEDGR